MFHHVGLSCMKQTNDQYDFPVNEYYPHWCTGGIWYNTDIFKTDMELYLNIYVLLYANTYMN